MSRSSYFVSPVAPHHALAREEGREWRREYRDGDEERINEYVTGRTIGVGSSGKVSECVCLGVVIAMCVHVAGKLVSEWV
jgi:hypothetical protein